MSENLNVHATLTAADTASPVIRGLLANLKKLEDAAKRLNTSFSSIGNAGFGSMTGFDRATQAATSTMNGFTTANRSASRSVSEGWRRATEQRLRDARSMYGSLGSMEASYQRQMERRSAGARPPRQVEGVRSAGSLSRPPTPSARTLLVGGAITGAGVASALKKRIEVDAAETRAKMFGDLSKADIGTLRGDFADRAGIKYGVGTSKVIDAATEGLKAGIAKQFAGEFADLALKAQSGLDVSATDTAKLMGRLSTQMPWNKGRFSKILNAVAVANNETAADGSEIIEGMRRSLSALATTKMTPEHLAALNATGISLGLQPGKTGTFLSFLTSQMAGAGSAHGQQAKDLNSAASSLGFGGRGGMAQAMRDSPIQTIQQMLDRLAAMPEALRTKVAKQIGGREWQDEILTLILGRDKLSDVLKQIEAKPDFLDKTALTKINSMTGRWASISAAFGLVWEKVGGGLEEIFDQITTSIIDLAGSFRFDTIKEHIAALTTGLRDGFGLKNWGDAIRALASSFDAGSIVSWKSFGAGFAEGISSFVGTIKSAFTGLASLVGKGDAAGMGKLVAQLLGLSVALAILAPILTTLAAFASFVNSIALVAGSASVGIAALFVALSVGLKMTLSYVADRIFSVFVSIVDAVQSVAVGVINKVRGWIGLAPMGGGGAGSANAPRTGTPGATGSWSPDTSGATGSWSPTTGKAVDHFSNLTKPASFTSGVTGGLNSTSYNDMFAGTALAGKDAQIIAAAKANGIDPALLSAVIAHETGKGRNTNANNVAGLMNPETGYRTKQGFASIEDGINAAARVVAKNFDRAGGDLNKMGSAYAPVGAANDPNGLNRYWPSSVANYRAKLGGVTGVGNVGSGGSPLDVAKQFNGLNEYRDNSVLKQFMGGRDPAGDANAWCAAFVNSSLKAVGGKGTGSAVANSFQRWGEAVNLEAVKAGDVLIQTKGRRPDQPGGHVGFATGEKRMFMGREQLQMFGGNQGDSAGYKWVDVNGQLVARRGKTLDSAIAGTNSPDNPTQNIPRNVTAHVPIPTSAQGGGGMGGGGGAGGPIAININGHTGDPETLATQVQRRIEETMNWRTHDMDPQSI